MRFGYINHFEAKKLLLKDNLSPFEYVRFQTCNFQGFYALFLT